MVEISGKYKIGTRRFGSINWIGAWTLYKKEVLRFLIVWIQTLFSPLITSLLFLSVLSLAIGNERGDVLGNFLGLICATGLASGAVIIRSAKKINLVPSAMMGKLLVALIAFFFTENLILRGNDIAIVPIMCIACVTIPFVLITLAPRYITAPEVNLFFLLETILGPLWVWLVITEQPSTETIVGGFVIISTIAFHSILSLKKT